MMLSNKESIIIVGTGLSPEDITPRTLRTIEAADILIGGRRQLSCFPLHRAKKIELKRDPAALVKGLRRTLKGKKTVVLACGDPNFFGIASLFYKTFDKERISVVPNITAFQAAFAVIKEPWDDAVLISIHGRDLSALDKIVCSTGTFVVYCDKTNSPAAAARYLLSKDEALAGCRTWIFDGLGGGAEKVLAGPLKKFKGQLSSALCMMVIKKTKGADQLGVGIPDNEFYHKKGMITKSDIRLIALSRLNLKKCDVLWDIGAGSGSIAIEAASLRPSLDIYAVEQNEMRYKELIKNIKKFKLPNIRAVHGSAPDVLKSLSSPDNVFIGGTAGRVEEILKLVKRKINNEGHVVINCIKSDTLSRVQRLFKDWHWQYDITTVQISRLSSKSTPEIFRAENPVFIVHGSE